MASPAFGAAGTRTSVTNTANVPRPSVSEGDLMVMFYSITSSDADFAPPGDWTLIQNRDPDDLFQSEGGAYYKVAGASEGANYSITISGQGGGNNVGEVIILSWTGVDTTTPVQVSAEQENASSTNVACPSVTTTSADTTLVCYYFNKGGGAVTFTPASGMTERHDGGLGTSPPFSIADLAVASAGATGTKTATASTAIESYTLSFAVASVAADTTIRPNSDVSITGWTSTGASVFVVIDEATADDADYATSPAITGSGQPAILGLSNGPLAAGDWAPRVRANVSAGTCTMRLTLVNDSNVSQGTVDVTVTTTITTYNPKITTTGSATRLKIEFLTT
jgi:hypothetical protein